MQSIVSYKDRGNFGNSKYRGNCTGYIIKDLIEHFYPTSKPKKFIEILVEVVLEKMLQKSLI